VPGSMSQTQFKINPQGNEKKLIFNQVLSFGIYVILGIGVSKLDAILPSRNTVKY